MIQLISGNVACSGPRWRRHVHYKAASHRATYRGGGETWGTRMGGPRLEVLHNYVAGRWSSWPLIYCSNYRLQLTQVPNIPFHAS